LVDGQYTDWLIGCSRVRKARKYGRWTLTEDIGIMCTTGSPLPLRRCSDESRNPSLGGHSIVCESKPR
jgi:hypothetical protein